MTHYDVMPWDMTHYDVDMTHVMTHSWDMTRCDVMPWDMTHYDVDMTHVMTHSWDMTHDMTHCHIVMSHVP